MRVLLSLALSLVLSGCGLVASTVDIGPGTLSGSNTEVPNRALVSELPNRLPTTQTLGALNGSSPSVASLNTRFAEVHTANPEPVPDFVNGVVPALSEIGLVLNPNHAAYAIENQEQLSGHAVSLSHLAQEALDNNIDIQIAREELSLSEQQVVNRFLSFLPQVSASSDFQRLYQNVYDSTNAVFVDGSAEYEVLSASLEINQPVLDLSRLFAIQTSRIGKSAEQAGYLAEVQRVIFEITDAYYAVLSSHAGAAGAYARASVVSQQIASEANLVESGLATETGKLAMELERSNALLAATDYERQRETALATLADLTGIPVKSVPVVDIPKGVFEKLNNTDISGLYERALDNNYIIRQKKLNVMAMRSDLRADFAEEYLPKLSAYGRYDYEDRGGSRFGGASETGDYTVGFGLRVPLFNAGGSGYASREKTYAYRLAVLDEAKTRRQIDSEIRSLIRRMKRVRDGMNQAGASSQTANLLIAQQTSAAETGTDVAASTLPYRVQLARANGEALRLRFELARVWMNLMYLTGEDFISLFEH